MSTEQEYDEQVGPLLKALADKCESMGVAMACRIEWLPGEAAVEATTGALEYSRGMKLATLACLCHGNVDNLFIHLLRCKGAEGSMFLAPHLRNGL